MKAIINTLSFLLITATANAQDSLYNAGTISIANGGLLYVSGNLTNTSSADLRVSGDLYLNGNLANDQVMNTYYGGTTRFTGSTLQSLSGAAAYLTSNALVDNPAGVVFNLNNMWVDDTLTFNSGLINAPASSYPIGFTVNAGHTGASDTSHVNGWVQKMGTGSFTYPVGNDHYEPVTTNLTANADGMLCGYFNIDAGAAAYTAPLQHYNNREYWHINPLSTASGTVTINWDAYNNTGIGNTADLVVAHKTGGNWISEGAAATTGTTSSGSVTSANTISTWSPFTLGSIAPTSPLPVTLVSFSGTALENNVHELNWEVAAAENIDRYRVEVSPDGKTFTVAGFVVANDSKAYSFRHHVDKAGKYFYRLGLIEYGETINYSKVIQLQSTGAGNIASLYPNPAGSEITLTLPGNTMTQDIRIYNMAGTEVLSATISGTAQTLDIHRLPAAMYSLTTGTGTFTFIKQ